MKLQRIHGVKEDIIQAATKIHPKQIIQIIYCGDNFQLQPIYDLWYWVPEGN